MRTLMGGNYRRPLKSGIIVDFTKAGSSTTVGNLTLFKRAISVYNRPLCVRNDKVPAFPQKKKGLRAWKKVCVLGKKSACVEKGFM